MRFKLVSDDEEYRTKPNLDDIFHNKIKSVTEGLDYFFENIVGKNFKG
jgi:hypothetical protein